MTKSKEINYDDATKRIWGTCKEGSSSSTASGKNLDCLFNPPFSLMYNGSFDQAKVAAKLQKKWLMVNLQSEDEFSSFMLNRDTWSDESVQDAISASFIFWQIHNHKYESKKVCTYYNVSSFPTVLIIDPITGQKMHAWTGFIEPSKLLNVLLHYSLNNPNDCLQAIGHNTLKESASKTTEFYEPDDGKEDSEDYGDSTYDYSDEDDPEYDINEDIEDYEEADETEIEHKMEDHLCEDVGPLENTADDHYEENMEEDDNEEKYLSNTEEQKLTYLPLPEEPVFPKELVCRIGVRFPDGRRLQRNFFRTDSLKLLWSLCLSKMEEKEMSTPFYFMHSIPGAPSKSIVYGSDLTFEEAGLCNALVILVWLV